MSKDRAYEKERENTYLTKVVFSTGLPVLSYVEYVKYDYPTGWSFLDTSVISVERFDGTVIYVFIMLKYEQSLHFYHAMATWVTKLLIFFRCWYSLMLHTDSLLWCYVRS